MVSTRTSDARFPELSLGGQHRSSGSQFEPFEHFDRIVEAQALFHGQTDDPPEDQQGPVEGRGADQGSIAVRPCLAIRHFEPGTILVRDGWGVLEEGAHPFPVKPRCPGLAAVSVKSDQELLAGLADCQLPCRSLAAQLQALVFSFQAVGQP